MNERPEMTYTSTSENTQTTARTESGTVFQREDWEIEVSDVIALLKCIVSRDKRWMHVTEELVSINRGPLRKLIVDMTARKYPRG